MFYGTRTKEILYYGWRSNGRGFLRDNNSLRIMIVGDGRDANKDIGVKEFTMTLTRVMGGANANEWI